MAVLTSTCPPALLLSPHDYVLCYAQCIPCGWGAMPSRLSPWPHSTVLRTCDQGGGLGTRPLLASPPLRSAAWTRVPVRGRGPVPRFDERNGSPGLSIPLLGDKKSYCKRPCLTAATTSTRLSLGHCRSSCITGCSSIAFAVANILSQQRRNPLLTIFTPSLKTPH
jgi:hypothetical protein